MNRQGRPTEPDRRRFDARRRPSPATAALRIEEALIFEIGRADVTGVDLDEPDAIQAAPRRARAQGPIGLPGLSEPEAMRHYVRLSRMNYGIDAGHVSARLVHHEAQSAPQREDGAAAGLRRHPSAAAALDRAGRARADRRAVALAAAS